MDNYIITGKYESDTFYINIIDAISDRYVSTEYGIVTFTKRSVKYTINEETKIHKANVKYYADGLPYIRTKLGNVCIPNESTFRVMRLFSEKCIEVEEYNGW